MKTRKIIIPCAVALVVIVLRSAHQSSKSQQNSASDLRFKGSTHQVAALTAFNTPVLGAKPNLLPSNSLLTAVVAANPTPPANIYANEGGISEHARKQIAALETEKSHRTLSQLKMDSQLIYADRIRQGLLVAEGVPSQRVDLELDSEGRVLVDIIATISSELLAAIKTAGGNVLNDFPQFHSLRASLPLAEIEPLASRAEIASIVPAVRANVNSVDSQGDYTELANEARTAFGVNGAGVKVGVLSDSVDKLTGSQINGLVTVLAGQSGSPASGEGTAICEVVNDLAPGAQLYFATGFGSEANFAQNILNLRAAGCNIILDDVGYADESPFQDSMLAQTVNQVTAAGVLYFSAAGNSGNKDHGWSGTWEGDFSDGGLALGFGEAGRLHSFALNTNYNTVSSGLGTLRMDLYWSDPLGASTNDYDVFILSASGSNVVASSTNPQTGTQNPYESLGSLTAGELIVILKKSGAGRFLHLGTGGGRLSFNTSGSTRGHSCATNAFGIAAMYYGSAGGGTNAFAGGASETVELFSSDGLRRVFYQADGTPITPGNFSSTGGAVRQKPDLAGADGVTTDLGFLFSPFNGTSAATPHVAAIAALLLSYNPSLTTSQMRALLTTNAVDVDAAGVDRNAGYGVAMALPAMNASPRPPLVMKTSSTNNELTVSFNAVLGKAYTIQYTTLLTINPWMTLTNFTAASAYAGFADSLTNSQRYYRIQTTTN